MKEYHVSAYLEGSSRRKLYDRVKAKSGREAILKVQADRKRQMKHKSMQRYFKGENAHGWKATLSTDERQKRRAPRRVSSGFDGLW